jgi:soluble epoxide hydrolase / lipid-phosphate phosphatase
MDILITLTSKPIRAPEIPKERYAVPNIPVFFGAATNDFVCLAQTGKDSTKRLCTHSETVIKEYAGDHWVLFSHANEIAADLHDWIKGLSSINESSKL